MNGTQSDVITLNECSSRDPLYLVVGHVHRSKIQLFEHLALHLALGHLLSDLTCCHLALHPALPSAPNSPRLKNGPRREAAYERGYTC